MAWACLMRREAGLRSCALVKRYVIMSACYGESQRYQSCLDFFFTLITKIPGEFVVTTSCENKGILMSVSVCLRVCPSRVCWSWVLIHSINSPQPGVITGVAAAGSASLNSGRLMIAMGDVLASAIRFRNSSSTNLSIKKFMMCWTTSHLSQVHNSIQ